MNHKNSSTLISLVLVASQITMPLLAYAGPKMTEEAVCKQLQNMGKNSDERSRVVNVVGKSSVWLSGAMVAFAVRDYELHKQQLASADEQLKQLKIYKRKDLPNDPVARQKYVEALVDGTRKDYAA
jgi:hypothetical protein